MDIKITITDEEEKALSKSNDINNIATGGNASLEEFAGVIAHESIANHASMWKQRDASALTEQIVRHFDKLDQKAIDDIQAVIQSKL